MKQIRLNGALATAATFAAVFVFSTAVHAAPTSEEAAVRRFRDLFARNQDSPKSAEALAKLIYLPGRTLVETPRIALNPQTFFDELTAKMHSENPFDWYQESRKEPFQPDAPALGVQIPAPPAAIEKRLTIVLVPGVFGEFITTRAFEEVFAQPKSAYRDLWTARLAALNPPPAEEKPAPFDLGEVFRKPLKNPFAEKDEDAEVPNANPAFTDLRYSLEKLKNIAKPLEDLLEVSSVDGPDGKPLFNVVLFKTRILSLESLGDIREKSAIFSRRLEKFFNIVGYPDQVALVGYSRGTVVALDMLSQAEDAAKKPEWAKRARAVVTLGGVIYGSDLADEAVNVHHKNPLPAGAQQLTALNKLSAGLEKFGENDFSERLRIAGRNIGRWNEFFVTMARLQGQSLKGKELSEILADLKTQIETNNRLDTSTILKQAAEFALRSFKIQHLVTQYDENVEKMKVLANAAATAATQLATQARLDWWAAHTIPTEGIRYYSITGTMVPGEGPEEQRDLARNPEAYNPDLADYGTLTKSYGDLRGVTGVAINDSQVAAHKARFWPDLHPVLNPKQKKMDAVFLGTFGADHWGLALRVVNIPKAGKLAVDHNPFPRLALLKTIATTVEEGLHANR